MNWKRIVEVAVNAATLVLCCVLIVAVIYSHVAPQKSASGSSLPSLRGIQIDMPGVAWGDTRHTVVLVMSVHCRFCTASADFYRRLQEVAVKRGVPIIAVLPQPVDEARTYLANLHIPISVIKQQSLASLSVPGTPTLMIVGPDGKLTDSWTGQLSPDVEKEVLSKL
jgi:hypothetical protein